LSNSELERVVGCNLFCLPAGKGSRHPIRISYMSDNQFILQSSKIESKLNVGKKKNKREKEGKRKAERFPIRSFFSLAPGGFP